MPLRTKQYMYKVYSKARELITQRVFDGNFEGDQGEAFGTYWESVGNPTQAGRSRLAAYPTESPSGKLSLDGESNYVSLPTMGVTGLTSPLINWGNEVSFVIDAYKDDWTAGGFQTLIYGDNLGDSSGNDTAFRLDLNVQTSGKLTASVNRDGSLLKANYDLSSLSSGYHQIGFATDGQYIRLYVDGVNVSFANAGSVGTLRMSPTRPAALGYDTLNEGYYFEGEIANFAVYDTYLSTPNFLTMYQTRHMLNDDLLAWFAFVEKAGNKVYPEPSVLVTAGKGGVETFPVSGTIIGTPTWLDSEIYLEKSAIVITKTAGSATQGIQQQSGEECLVEGSTDYIAHARVKADSGETIRMTLTPTGGGSADTAEITANGEWQQLALAYTTGPITTKLRIKIEILSANASVKTFYVDQIALNDGSTAHDYFDQATEPVGSTVYSFDSNINAHLKTVTTRTFIGLWDDDVISEFSYSQDINSPGAPVGVQLARDHDSYGEGVDVDFNLDVQIFLIDENNPSGVRKFNGYISDYSIDEASGLIYVELFPYGAETEQYMLESGESTLQYMPIHNTQKDGLGAWGGSWFAQLVNPTESLLLRKVKLRFLAQSGASEGITVRLYKGDPSLNGITVLSGVATYNIDSGNTLIASTGTVTVNDSSDKEYTFEFSEDVLLEAGEQYYIDFIISPGVNIDVMTSGFSELVSVSSYAPIGRLYYANATINNSTFGLGTSDSYPQMYMHLIKSSGNTKAIYNSYDPSAIVRDIIANAQSQGSELTYDAASVPLSGTVVSYPFNTVTIRTALEKCLELAPDDWYWYIDAATNKVHFKPKSSVVQHKFILTKHLQNILFYKRTRSMVNVLYFTGGDDGSGNNFFKKYERSGSRKKYGRRLLPYSDNRVTNAETAGIIANRILNNRSVVEIRTEPEVITEYDIESVNVGDVVGFAGFDGDPTSQGIWDVGNWDEMYWDINVANPNTLRLQIANLTYTPGLLIVILSSAPPDVNKRIEDIARNLDKVNTADNPDSPG